MPNFRGNEDLCKLCKEYLNASLCRFVFCSLQTLQTETFVYLPLNNAEISMLKQVRFFGPPCTYQNLIYYAYCCKCVKSYKKSSFVWNSYRSVGYTTDCKSGGVRSLWRHIWGGPKQRDKGGRGVIFPLKLHDIIYGWPRMSYYLCDAIVQVDNCPVSPSAAEPDVTDTSTLCRVHAYKPSYELGASLPIKLPAKSKSPLPGFCCFSQSCRN